MYMLNLPICVRKSVLVFFLIVFEQKCEYFIMNKTNAKQTFYKQLASAYILMYSLQNIRDCTNELFGPKRNISYIYLQLNILCLVFPCQCVDNFLPACDNIFILKLTINKTGTSISLPGNFTNEAINLYKSEVKIINGSL